MSDHKFDHFLRLFCCVCGTACTGLHGFSYSCCRSASYLILKAGKRRSIQLGISGLDYTHLSSGFSMASIEPTAATISSTRLLSSSQWADNSRRGMYSKQTGHCFVSARLAKGLDMNCKAGRRIAVAYFSLRESWGTNPGVPKRVSSLLLYIWCKQRIVIYRRPPHFDEASIVISSQSDQKSKV